jgi:cyclase
MKQSRIMPSSSWMRRDFFKAAAMAPAIAAVKELAGPSAAVAQQTDQLAGVALTTFPVAGNVYMVQRPGGGGNAGALVGPDGALLVDAMYAPLADRLVAAVQQIRGVPIRFLVNTHVHPDHIGGNEPLADKGVLIFAHDNLRLRTLERLRFPRMRGTFAPQPAVRARPVITYNDAMTFHLNGEDVRAFHVPRAHTDGDSFVHFPQSNVLHLGDVFRTSSYPIIDVYNGGSLTGTIDALDLAIRLAGPETKIIPGHGLAIVGRGAVVEFRNMLLDIRDRVRTMITEQKTLAEVMTARPTANYDAQWGQEATWTATDFIPVVYHELGGLR